MKKQNRDEYYILTEKLDEIDCALEGKCDDIDCNKYMYKDLLKKSVKFVLDHEFSCISKLNRDRNALMGLLSLKKFRKFRYKKCSVCKNLVDTLGKDSVIVSCTRPEKYKGEPVYAVEMFRAHRKCKRKVKIPEGWKKGF